MFEPEDLEHKERLKTGEPIHDMWLDRLALMREEMGGKRFNEFAINLAKAEEIGLRKRIPDHPLLKLLDAHRAREENGFF